MKLAAILSLVLLALVARADLVPVKGQSDLRVRYADYKPDDVVVVAVALGVMTRVVLNPDETIVKAEPGFPSNCERAGDEWCIKAEPGTNQIWVNPRSRATKNNLEISTNKRDYSLKFVVMPGQENAPTVYYRVIFRYALPPVPMKVAAKGAPDMPAAEEAAPDVQSQEFSEPIVRNANYSKQTAADSEEIAPSVVFDDGRFTYFRYPKNREIPAIFAIGPAGEEIRVNTHSARLSADPENPKARVTNDYLVVQRLSKKFILRLGSAVVNILNEEFDANGIETWNGTTTPNLVRKNKAVEPK
jgi:type IV secretion system protein VirB9